jgi:hypothetical protein
MGLWTQWEWLSEAQEGMVKDSWVGKPRVELQSSSRMGLSGWVSKMLSLTGDSGVVSWPGGMGKRDSSSAISSVSNSNEPPATRNRKLLGHQRQGLFSAEHLVLKQNREGIWEPVLPLLSLGTKLPKIRLS